jgi:hypothetical protein
MAGLLAAISAARHGAKVILVTDRPVLGGNASSEIRMHICGAHGKNMRETGILEELLLENHYRNYSASYSIWDSVLYGAAQYQDGLTLLLNCSVNALTMDGNRIASVSGWQTTTETTHTVNATLFADCSGDGILAPLSGADFRVGREARSEFDESIAPEVADKKTMGMSCLLQARETDSPQQFTPPSWAHVYESDEDLNNRGHGLGTNFWWIETGGQMDSIHDAETCREDLLKIAFGVWDHIKNRGDHDAANWVLDWVGFLPGKRESRRYIGDHVLTQNDVESGGRFDDLVAYGGWTMDDHFPAGFYHPGRGTIFHPAPSPFGIPYRSLYSRNVENLFCAGRNHSATHAAMSATRVMGTTSMMGQAVGTAAALALQAGTTPRDVYDSYLGELKQTLMDDDCYLPWNTRGLPELTTGATLTTSAGDGGALRNGVDRPVGEADNGWRAPLGASATYEFSSVKPLSQARVVFDSTLNRPHKNMPHNQRKDAAPFTVPDSLVKSFRIETADEEGAWSVAYRCENNYRRLVRVPLSTTAKGVRFVAESTWGSEEAHVFSFDVS